MKQSQYYHADFDLLTTFLRSFCFNSTWLMHFFRIDKNWKINLKSTFQINQVHCSIY